MGKSRDGGNRTFGLTRSAPVLTLRLKSHFRLVCEGHMRKFIACLGLVLLMSSPSLSASAAESRADARFKAIYSREWDWRQAELAGEIDEDSRESVADRLPRLDPASQQARLD